MYSNARLCCAQRVHGVELVREVIAKIEAFGMGVLGRLEPPMGLPPHLLEAMRFPNGTKPSPALLEWLAYDVGFLGWFDDVESLTEAQMQMPSRSVGAFAAEYFTDPSDRAAFRALELPREDGTPPVLSGDCYLLPQGRLARRFLYIGEPDSVGEPPVLVADTDGTPFLAVEYPGIDVYLAVRAKIILRPAEVFGSFADDPEYAGRMQEHRDRILGGERSIKYGDPGFELDVEQEVDHDKTIVLQPGEPMPEGHVIVEHIVNPMMRRPMRLIAPASAVRWVKRRKAE